MLENNKNVNDPSPSFLDFKSKEDVNFAMSNALEFVFQINRSKFLLDAQNWAAENSVNEDLFFEARTSSDDTTQVEYIPRYMFLPSTYQENNISYKVIDDRVALLALSWWTLFISTKDGKRMILYPWTSQILDKQSLKEYPASEAWFKDMSLSQYFKSKGINVDLVPDFFTKQTISNQSSEQINYFHLDVYKTMVSTFLKQHGLDFVLWLYNYIKLNKGLVPYDCLDEYIYSINDVPIKRNGESINFTTNLGKSLPSDSTSAKETGQIDGATAMSQTSFRRNRNSCGLIINTPESVKNLTYTNDNLISRLNTKFKTHPHINGVNDTVRDGNKNISLTDRIDDEANEMVKLFNKMKIQIPINPVSSELISQRKFYNMIMDPLKRNIKITPEQIRKK